MDKMKWNEKITVGSPKKVLEGDLVGPPDMYYCEVYLPYNVGKKRHPIYADSPVNATNYANKFVEAHLLHKISRAEELLKEKDIRQKLTEGLEWAKQELTRHKQEKK